MALSSIVAQSWPTAPLSHRSRFQLTRSGRRLFGAPPGETPLGVLHPHASPPYRSTGSGLLFQSITFARFERRPWSSERAEKEPPTGRFWRKAAGRGSVFPTIRSDRPLVSDVFPRRSAAGSMTPRLLHQTLEKARRAVSRWACGMDDLSSPGAPMHERWRRPDATSTKGWAKGAEAATQSGESTDAGATDDRHQRADTKTGPMCISRRLLEPYAHGAGLIVAAFSAGEHLAMRPASPPMVIAILRRLCLAESRALTSSSSWSSWRLSWSPWQTSLLSSLSLPCLPRGFGWLDECADAANQRAHHQANTKLAKTIPRWINEHP